ncbi:MAG: glycosyltransferase family 2 protein [Halanaerobiaceae bacterium]
MTAQKYRVPSYKKHEYQPKQTQYCVGVPVLNEGRRFLTQLTKMKKQAAKADIIIFDGGSDDGSTEHNILKENNINTLLVKTGPGGLSAQLRMGFDFALKRGYSGIITVDGNNKDNVEAIPDFIKALAEGQDFIQGSRYLPGGRAVNTPLHRTLAIKLIHVPVISLVAGFKYTDTTNGFRGYSRKFLTDPEVNPFRDIFDSYELLGYLSVKAPELNYRVKEIPVTRRYPARGQTPTKISHFKGNLQLMKILVDLCLHRYDVD